jgi:short-subunit dehydrogenase
VRNRRQAPVVVITGASSGIGRAAALGFARKRVSLVLAARSATCLEDVAAECRKHGAQALVVPTEVSEEAQVQNLARTAVEHFGRIDVWVGAAAAYAYGTVEQTPPEVFERLLQVNLTGQVHGVRAVLPTFRAQGRGTLILVGSVFSKITAPYVSAYVASKFGLAGFSQSLRQELLAEKGIHVCLLLPATIDTPIYQHAANYTGREIHPLPPVVSPERVGRAIVRLAGHPRPETVVGRMQGSFIPFQRAAPRIYDRIIARMMGGLGVRGDGVPASGGTVFTPLPASNAVTGGWRSKPARLAAGGLAGAAAVVAFRRTRAGR